MQDASDTIGLIEVRHFSHYLGLGHYVNIVRSSILFLRILQECAVVVSAFLTVQMP